MAVAQLPNRGRNPTLNFPNIFPFVHCRHVRPCTSHALTLAHKQTFVVGLLVREVSVLARRRRKGRKKIIIMKKTRIKRRCEVARNERSEPLLLKFTPPVPLGTALIFSPSGVQ